MNSSKPQFKRYFKVETLAPDAVYLLSEQNRIALSGRLYFLLAPLLDGQHSLAQITDMLNEQASALQIQYALARLRRAGYLTENDGLPTDPPIDQAAFWDLQEAHSVALRDRRVSVYTSKSLSGSAAAQILGLLGDLLIPLGIQCVPPDSDRPGDLAVWIVDDYLDPALEVFNRRAVQHQHTWMIIKPIGSVLWIGPNFSDGTACWACLQQRLVMNRNVEEFVRVQKQLATPLVLSRAALPSTIQTGLALVATEIARKLATPTDSHLRNQLFTLDTLSLQIEWHTLVKRPQCPVCGDPSLMTAQVATPLSLHSQKKRSTADNGHRSEAAAATYERYKYHVSPITGAVSLLESNQDIPGIHTYLSGDNRARASEWQQLRRGLRRSTSGKGVHAIQAKVSALCEALERYSGVFQGDEPHQIATYAELGASAVHPNECLNFSVAQYRDRKALNRVYPPLCHIVEPFDPLTPIAWTPVWSLTDQLFKYVPTAYCYYDYVPPGHSWTCYADSNGCAAGSSLEDAIFQGFMELVERDSVSIWWFNRIQRPAIDLDSLGDPFIDTLRDQYASMQREFWVLDVTTDLNIPAFVAISRRTDKPAEDIIMGAGAHFEARVAILRALTEMNQMLRPVSDVDKSGNYASDNPHEVAWWQHATLDMHPYLAADTKRIIRVNAYPTLASDDLYSDVLKCVQIARDHHLEFLVLDQTRVDIELPVVRVIVPGLRFYWQRFAPGRLYQVPIDLGWLDTPLREDQLNPEFVIF